jgi:hypothetical protein
VTASNSLCHAARPSGPLAAQTMKVSDWVRRGNPCAVLRPAPGLREQTERYLQWFLWAEPALETI